MIEVGEQNFHLSHQGLQALRLESSATPTIELYYLTINFAISRATIFATFIIGFMAGPAVSL